MITDDGCWTDYRTEQVLTAGRPCLFLDRDGVIIEDTGYPHDPAKVVFIPETLDLVRQAKDQGFVVGIVTNQSGIGRGYFGWDAFVAVQNAIDAALLARRASVDFILACPHHADAALSHYRSEGHPWRKPAPGMLVEALRTLCLAPSASVMLGDQTSDMKAAEAAQVKHRGLFVEQRDGASEGNWTVVERRNASRWISVIGRMA